MSMKQRQIDAHALESLTRLAEALDTTVDELLLHVPNLWGDTAREGARLEVIGLAECMRLLRTVQIGRVAWCSALGPNVLPVTYALVAGRPVYRTTETSPLGRLDGQRVAFHVDSIDAARHEGWSVLLTGTVRAVTAAEASGRGVDAAVEPWPGGRRDTYMIVAPEHVTGRRVVRTVGG